MRKWKWGAALAVLSGCLLSAGELSAKCFIFVHGHQNGDLNYAQARDTWKGLGRDMVGLVARDNEYFIVHWDSTRAYWDASAEVAARINHALNGGADGGGNRCLTGETDYIVVAHSFANTVMDFILGNSRAPDPYYNYGGADFANIGDRLSAYVSLQGGHRGIIQADAICGNSSAANNWLASFVGQLIGATCDPAVESMQTADNWEVKNRANSPRVTAHLIAGYKPVFLVSNSALLPGEDDGVTPYPSALACGGNATTAYTKYNACTNDEKSELFGFRNCDQSYENHTDGPTDSARNARRALTGGCWSARTNGQQVRSSMSSAELIRCIWAYKPAGDTSCN
jgi:hypothetical protein